MRLHEIMLCVAVMLCLLMGPTWAGVALNQDFDGFTPGALNLAGQGTAADVGGFWGATANASDPSIVAQDPNFSGELSVRLKEGQAMAYGYSDVAPIAQGEQFVVSFSVNLSAIGASSVGSFYMYVDNMNNLSVDSKGIALQTETNTSGFLLLYDASVSAFRVVRGVNMFLSRGQWIDFKIVVTTWSDGTGFGRYDTYLDTGSGWKKVDGNNAMLVGGASGLHDGVNAMLLRPRAPAGEVLAHFDNIHIASTPVDCMDVQLLGYELAGDITKDCDVDVPDVGGTAQEWLRCNQPGDAGCDDAVVLLEQNFDDTALFSPAAGGGPIGDSETTDGLWLWLRANNIPGIDDTLAYSGTQSLQFNRSNVPAHFVDVRTMGIPDGANYEIEAWVYREENGALGLSTLKSENAAWPGDYEIAMYFDATGRVQIRDFILNKYELTGLFIDPDEWYRLRILVDRGANTYTVTIKRATGVEQTTGWNPSFVERAGVKTIRFSPQAPDLPITHVDNVSVRLSHELADCAAVKAAGLGLDADFSNDCYVNLIDFSLLAQNWLLCNDPQDGGCVVTW